MDSREDKSIIYKIIKSYIKQVEKNNIKVWRLYLYGSYAKTYFDIDN